MKRKSFSILILALAIIQIAAGQERWGTQGKYLTKNGKPVYLSGTNYIISDGWLLSLPNMTKETMDADMAAMEHIGLNHIRFFPFWYFTQPTKDKLDEKVMKQIDLLTESAARHNISLQISPITGALSGFFSIPTWVGDMVKDKTTLDAQKFLIKTIASRYKNNPAVLGYDFGNEINNLIPKTDTRRSTPEEVFGWMKAVYSGFKEGSPDQLVANGIGTGYGDLYDVRNIGQTSDYLAPHTYPYFLRIGQLDPWFGQRTTYNGNFMITWCEMVGKPVVVQETGCSESWLPASNIGDYIRLTYLSTWADGAAGYLWWCSHNLDTTVYPKLRKVAKEHSKINSTEFKFADLELNMGLLTKSDQPKDYSLTFGECIKTVEKLGFDWIDDLPVCYIIAPGNMDFDNVCHKYVTSYTLAKQVHFDVKLLYEGLPIPSDAAAVIIPGIKLSGKSKEVVQDYLLKGGKVYQSYENDFGTNITVGADTMINNPSFTVDLPFGQMETLLPMSVPCHLKSRKAVFYQPARDVVTYQTKEIYWSAPANGNNAIFIKQNIGKGVYFYLTCDLEEGLTKTYNPWPNTNCELFYSVLKPETPIDIDNKYVELSVKHNAGQSIVLLLNHSENYQNVTIKSMRPILLTNYETGEKIGAGKQTIYTLKPGEVLIANYK